MIAGEGAIEGSGDQPVGSAGVTAAKVIEEVVAAALIIGAGLWNGKGCIRADDTRGAWIRVGIDEARRPWRDSKKGP